MAVDELLLEQAVVSGTCALRWYRWDRPTISLGHFQDPRHVSEMPELATLPIVRRLSGGGAIVHDCELTYSCGVPAAHPLAVAPRELYTLVHEAIIGVLRPLGVAAQFRGAPDSSRASEFLCFGRGDSFDVVIGPHKVLGSAQRRRKGAILQHGSLVIGRSTFAPQFPGINDLSPRPVVPLTLVEVLAAAVGAVLSPEPRLGRLTSGERRIAEDRAPVAVIR